MKRRTLLRAGAASTVLIAMRSLATNVVISPVLSALARAYAGPGIALREGRVKFDITPLVENGNSVPVEVTVESPMTAAQYVTGIAIFTEKNPQNDVAVFELTPLCGRGHVATRIRLATSQQLVAVAKMNDGSCWTHTVEVVVTTASCVEE